MFYAVSFTKTEIVLFNSNNFTKKHIKFEEALKFLRDHDYSGIEGLTFFNENQKDKYESGDYSRIVCINSADAKTYRPKSLEVVLVSDSMRPCASMPEVSINNEDFKMYFRKDVLLLWYRGYFYCLENNGDDVLLNGNKIAMDSMPDRIGYVVKEDDGYAIYTYDRWLKVTEKHLLYCFTKDVFYGQRGTFEDFKKLVMRAK